MDKKIIIIFLLILCIAASFRFFMLGKIPPGINRDEGSIGYSAYSLLLTGKDEYARTFPLSFESFGDWKLPLYIYITMPFVALLGLNELAIRFPSALFGTLSVALTFFFVQKIFHNKKLALCSMLLAAISPWSIHLSRVESEANTAVFLTLLAVLFFLASFKKHQWFLVISALFFALCYFTYAGNHISTTLLVMGFGIFYYSALPKTSWRFIAIVSFFLLVGIIFTQTLFGASKTKISGIGIFGDPSIVHARIELPRLEHENHGSFFARIYHNRVTFAIEKIAQIYLQAFSPDFLFINGGTNKAHNIANVGNMYLMEAPFFFFGIMVLIFSKKTREKKLLLWWLFTAPIAASITKDAPHTNRMFAIFPILQITTAVGIFWFIEQVPKIAKKFFIGIIAFGFLFSIGLYVDRYFIHFPRNEAENWGIGYKKLAEQLALPSYKEKNVIIDKSEYSPYIFLLFYTKYDPLIYQKNAQRYPATPDRFYHVKGYSRFVFRPIDFDKDIFLPNTLLITHRNTNENFSQKNNFVTKDIMLPNGKPLFTIIQTK